MKIHIALLRRVAIAGAAAAVLVPVHAGPLANGSFESDLTGWTFTHNVDSSNVVNFPMSVGTDGPGPYFSPVDGSRMLILAGGRGSSVIVSQTFTLYAGQTLSGAAGVSGEAAIDSPVPFFINGLVTIQGPGATSEQILWSNALNVQPGQAFYPPWQTWSTTVPQTGDYTLHLVGSNAGFYGATARFDAIQVVPDSGATAWLLGAAVAALAALGRWRRVGSALRTCAPLGFAAVVLGAAVVAAPLTNGSFEDGLTGWTLTVATGLDSRGNSSTATTTSSAWGFVPVGGALFAELQPVYGGQVALTQTFTMTAGERLSGYAGGIAPAPAVSYPSELNARVILSVGGGESVTLWSVDLFSAAMPAPPVDDVAPWQQWSYFAPATGTYTLALTAQSGFGGAFAMFDQITVPDTTPTLAGLLVGIGALTTWRAARRHGMAGR